MKPLITVIVPIYKIEKYLPNCLDSIINQSYDNLEIILVDDGSRDKCSEICDNYQRKDQRIKVIHKKNEGVSVARNIGIKLAKGDYLAFVDGDDWINHKMFEILIEDMITLDADLAVCGYNNVFEELIISSDSNGKMMILNSNQTLSSIFTEKKIRGFMWNKLFKKELFNNLKLPEDMDICEDLFIVSKILRNNNLIASYNPLSLYNYRIDETSATNRLENLFTDVGELKYLLALDRIAGLFENQHVILEQIDINKVHVLVDTFLKLNHNLMDFERISNGLHNELEKYKTFYLQNNYITLANKMKYFTILKFPSSKIIVNKMLDIRRLLIGKKKCKI